MSLRDATVRLRLVNAGGTPVAAVRASSLPVVARRRGGASPIATMRSEATTYASALAATDARWVLASRVSDSLQGGRAGVLPPESRTKLLDLGRRLGLRPFDCNLIIAIVQDHARCGGGTGGEPRSEMVERLTMVPGTTSAIEARELDGGARVWWFAWIGATVILATIFAAAGLAWLNG
jgi:hypothetical protein